MDREFHPVANVFPLMTGPAFDELVADIRANGLHVPIVLHPDGRILDGRNRYRACAAAGVEPTFLTCDQATEGDYVNYVVSLNLRRRHLDEAQRSMVAARIATYTHGGDRKSAEFLNSGLEASLTDAAALMKVSRDSVWSARKVLTKGVPELVGAVDAGDMSLREATEISFVPTDEQVPSSASHGPNGIASSRRCGRSARRRSSTCHAPAFRSG